MIRSLEGMFLCTSCGRAQQFWVHLLIFQGKPEIINIWRGRMLAHLEHELRKLLRREGSVRNSSFPWKGIWIPINHMFYHKTWSKPYASLFFRGQVFLRLLFLCFFLQLNWFFVLFLEVASLPILVFCFFWFFLNPISPFLLKSTAERAGTTTSCLLLG